MLCLLSLLIAMGAEAQEERNVVYTTGINELQYTKKESKPTAGEVIGEVLTALVTGEKYIYVCICIYHLCLVASLDAELTDRKGQLDLHYWCQFFTMNSLDLVDS